MRGNPAPQPALPPHPRDRHGIPANIFYGVTDEAEIKKLAEAWKPIEQEKGSTRSHSVKNERGKSEGSKTGGWLIRRCGGGKKGGQVKGGKVEKDHEKSERVLRSNRGGKLVDGLP